MKINKTKTKALLFNTARKKDFTTNLKIDNKTVELVEEMKLLGVHHPGQRCISYSNALQVSSLDRLDTRREAVCLKFARNLTRNQKFFNWFVEDSKIIETRRVKKDVKDLKDILTITRRLRDFTIPYLTHLLNLKGFISDPDNIQHV